MENKRHCFIFDLDGTLANVEHRLNFIKREKPDWNMFNEMCLNDQPIIPVVNMARLLADTHHIVICILSLLTSMFISASSSQSV